MCAVILAESHFRTDATSGCGAQGLGQLMPSTAAGLGVSNAYDPVREHLRFRPLHQEHARPDVRLQALERAARGKTCPWRLRPTTPARAR